MKDFVRRFQSRLPAYPLKMNCCLSMQQCADNIGSTRLILPGGIEIWVRYPQNCASTDDCLGDAYLSDYDIWSPELPPEELGDWVTNSLRSCRRVDAFFDAEARKPRQLNCSWDDATVNRIKTVWRAAQAGVDLPKHFRYGDLRTEVGWVKATLFYYSERLHEQTWIIKSGLSMEEDPDKENTDGWGFQPDFRPLTESLHKARKGYSVDMGTELYLEAITGDTPEQRDRKAAYWLVQILSDIVDEALKNPPPRCYHVLLADNAANLRKSDLERMSIQGITALLRKGILTGEQVLKGKPEMFDKLLEKGLVSGEMVARRLPDKILWLAKKRYITPDYALKLQPSLKDKLIRAKLYEDIDVSGYTNDQLIAGLKDGTITPTAAYRANPKLLQPMVEQGLITPQEAYKLDASIVTWLLLNHYIGRAEAKRVKADIERYVKQKYRDVDWESLDSSRDLDMIRYEGGQVVAAITTNLTEKNLQKALAAAIKEDPETPSATVRCGDVEAWVSPAGYGDNKLIVDGDLANATVYVTLSCDYQILKTESGNYDTRMKGSEVLDYINQAAQKYHIDKEDLDSSKNQKLNSAWDDTDTSEWEFIRSKDVRDWDGYWTEYCWYRNTATGKNVFVFGDSELYRPEDGEYDFETKNDEEAQEWFDSYTGADDDDLDSSLNSSNAEPAMSGEVTDTRVINGTNYFCVEGKSIGDDIQYQQQLQTYMPGYEVSSSGYADRLYVKAPPEAADVVKIAVENFNRDHATDLDSCGIMQVSDIAQTTTFPEKKSVNSDLTDVNQQVNEEMRDVSQLALAGLTSLENAAAQGPIWKVTIKYPGDLLSDYTTDILIPAATKAEAQVKFNELLGNDATIISWGESFNNIDDYRAAYPYSNLDVLE